MKPTTTRRVSVDGVMQGSAGRDEHGSGALARGGWARSPFDDESMAFVGEVGQRAGGLLRG